jgi:hypothetical protein
VISECETGKPFAVRKATQKISLRVILRAVFGLNEGARYQQLEQLLGSLLYFCCAPADWDRGVRGGVSSAHGRILTGLFSTKSPTTEATRTMDGKAT